MNFYRWDFSLAKPRLMEVSINKNFVNRDPIACVITSVRQTYKHRQTETDK